jgi:hypothetical protein
MTGSLEPRLSEQYVGGVASGEAVAFRLTRLFGGGGGVSRHGNLAPGISAPLL